MIRKVQTSDKIMRKINDDRAVAFKLNASRYWRLDRGDQSGAFNSRDRWAFFAAGRRLKATVRLGNAARSSLAAGLVSDCAKTPNTPRKQLPAAEHVPVGCSVAFYEAP